MRGVVLAGGVGSRLGLLSRVTNKHLLAVGHEPMICHPIRSLTEAGIREILVVTGTEHAGAVFQLLGSGTAFGAQFTFRVQDQPGGIAQAIGLAEEFAGGRPITVILGDNIFGAPIDALVALEDHAHAHVLLKRVPDPERFGVADVLRGRIVSLEEKPARPKSDMAVTGAYAFPPDVFDVIRGLRPSARGELEVTDALRVYLDRGHLGYSVVSGFWSDAGTLESLRRASEFVWTRSDQKGAARHGPTDR